MGQVLIPKYGLEGTLYLRAGNQGTSNFQFDPEVPSQTSQCGVSLTLFQKLTVRILLDDSNVQHEKLVLKLVTPTIKDFSVEPIGESSTPTENKESKKRKSEGASEAGGSSKKCKK